MLEAELSILSQFSHSFKRDVWDSKALFEDNTYGPSIFDRKLNHNFPFTVNFVNVNIGVLSGWFLPMT